MEKEYTIIINFDEIATILMNLEAESQGKLSHVVSYSGNTVSLTSTSLECLINTVATELSWIHIWPDTKNDKILVKNSEDLASNHYSLTITDNVGNTIFYEKAISPDNGSSYIAVTHWTESTMVSIARDLLRDIIPTKGSYSSKSRLWNMKTT